MNATRVVQPSKPSDCYSKAAAAIFEADYSEPNHSPPPIAPVPSRRVSNAISCDTDDETAVAGGGGG